MLAILFFMIGGLNSSRFCHTNDSGNWQTISASASSGSVYISLKKRRWFVAPIPADRGSEFSPILPYGRFGANGKPFREVQRRIWCTFCYKNGADLWHQYLPIGGPNSRRFCRIGDSGELANHFGECNVGLGVHFVKKPAPICGASTCRSGVRIPADSAVPAIRRSWKTISLGATSDRASYYAETTVKSSSNLLAIGVLHCIRGVSGSYSKTKPIFQNRKKGISGEFFSVSLFKKLALKLFYICRTTRATVF